MGPAPRRPASVPGNREALWAGCHRVSVNTQATHPIPAVDTGWCCPVLGHFDSLSGLL